MPVALASVCTDMNVAAVKVAANSKVLSKKCFMSGNLLALYGKRGGEEKNKKSEVKGGRVRILNSRFSQDRVVFRGVDQSVCFSEYRVVFVIYLEICRLVVYVTSDKPFQYHLEQRFALSCRFKTDDDFVKGFDVDSSMLHDLYAARAYRS